MASIESAGRGPEVEVEFCELRKRENREHRREITKRS